MENMVCFITCVNDDELYKESLLYIQQLEIPQGFSVECRAVRNARSMTSGYNAAMKSSSAKYKIYLHQDIFILNKRFLFDLLDIFKNDKDVGIIGMVGSVDIPDHGVWWESGHTLGCTYDALSTITRLPDYGRQEDRHGEAKIVDGLLIATQYDLPWREDLFDGWHFYDASQCGEFLRRNYKVLVADQYTPDGTPKPWCLHYMERTVTTAYYENYRTAYLNEYMDLRIDNVAGGAKEKLPDISIVLLIGDTIDTLWVRLDEIEKYISKDSYQLILIVEHLDKEIQQLFEKDCIKILFKEPDESAAILFNKAVETAEKQNDILLLDYRSSLSGSITISLQHAIHNTDDVGAICCTSEESNPEISTPEGLFTLYKRSALDKTGVFDEQYRTVRYTVYDYAIRLSNIGYKVLTRNLAGTSLQSNDDPNDLQIDKAKFNSKFNHEDKSVNTSHAKTSVISHDELLSINHDIDLDELTHEKIRFLLRRIEFGIETDKTKAILSSAVSTGHISKDDFCNIIDKAWVDKSRLSELHDIVNA